MALAQARQNYAGVDVARTNVANAQAQLALARKNLSYAVIPAPIDGFVSERTADLGEYVSPQQKVVTIVQHKSVAHSYRYSRAGDSGSEGGPVSVDHDERVA